MHEVLLSRHWSQEVDRRAVAEYGLSGLVLMENAGRGLADVLTARLRAADTSPSGAVAICCGRGNNGGDGFVLARHLDLRGYPVRVLLWGDPDSLSGDAAANFHVLRQADIAVELMDQVADPNHLRAALADASWAVDALLGTGARGEPRPPLDRVIGAMNAAACPKLAVDVPSGLDCDTGQAAQHTVRATVTCTFVAKKTGFAAATAAPYLGEVEVLDIGAPVKLYNEIIEAAKAERGGA